MFKSLGLNMSIEDAVLNTTPALSPMFRLQWEEVQQAWVLLYPEGMVKLNGSAGEIIKRLDGKKNVLALIAELEKDFDATGLQSDVLAFLEIASQQGWVKT
jgi:pyrroloquinoline quinone biosynthesis protein D